MGPWAGPPLSLGLSLICATLGSTGGLPVPWLRACQRQHKVDNEVSTKGCFQVFALPKTASPVYLTRQPTCHSSLRTAQGHPSRKPAPSAPYPCLGEVLLLSVPTIPISSLHCSTDYRNWECLSICPPWPRGYKLCTEGQWSHFPGTGMELVAQCWVSQWANEACNSDCIPVFLLTLTLDSMFYFILFSEGVYHSWKYCKTSRCMEWMEQAPIPSPNSKNPFNILSSDRGRIRY